MVASLNSSNDGDSVKKQVDDEHPTDCFSFKFVTAGDITRIIKYLKNTKAEGVDDIPTEVWKKGVVVLAGPMGKKVSHAPSHMELLRGQFWDLCYSW